MRFRMRVPVRFRDLDLMGHVHHTVPLLYVEEARAAYWREVAGRPQLGDIDYVMGGISMRYHKRIDYPATVTVELCVSDVGTRSFRMEFRILDAAGDLLVSGQTTQVMYDYARGESMEIPAELRARIAAWEAGGNASAEEQGDGGGHHADARAQDVSQLHDQ